MRSSSTSSRLLVVDDDPRITRMLLRVAEGLGFQASAIASPADFDRAYDEADPDVILLDLNMPGVDGVELLRRLAAWGSTAEIFLISGVAQRVLDTTALLGTELGLRISGSLSKPVDIDVLRDQLSKLLPRLDAPVEEPARRPRIDVASLRNAIYSDQLTVVYQPQVELRSGKPFGAEALVRWRHPTRGQIFPDQFIPLAEETGLVVALTDRVAELALDDWCRWGDVVDGLSLAINLSAGTLDDLRLPDRLAEMVQKREIEASRLVLEITETAAMEDPAKSMDILTRLRIKGFGLSIDDFGTGASSLKQLYRLPYEEIKVDRSFVSEGTTRHEAATIVRSTIDLGHNLGLRVVAEGIEDQATLDWLTNLGCDVGQGYFLGRPMNAERFEQWLREYG